MVRTGARATALQRLLMRAGLQPALHAPSAPRLDELSSEAQTAVTNLYDDLAGLRPIIALRPGAWDLSFADGIVVELDEELHFNRYRLNTLQNAASARLPWRDEYIEFCRRHEEECLQAGTWGKRWTSPSCEAMFGPPGHEGVLQGGGSPRWKQRALYDAMKDVAASDTRILHLARLSVWDTIGDIKLGEALSLGLPVAPQSLRDLVARRTTEPTART